MTVVLHNSPFEIIELISDHVAKRDLLNLILTSKSYHDVFHPFIYKSITLNTVEILKSFKLHQLPGFLVKKLILTKDIHLTEDDILDINQVFPQFDTLNLDWSIWSNTFNFQDHFDSEATISYIHPPQGLPPTLYQFFKSAGPRLKSLTINASNHELVDIWSILALCPKLKYLHLTNLNHEHIVTLGYLEILHQLCPQLITLSIKCTTADPNPALLPQYQQKTIKIQSTSLQSFSLASKSGSSKWPLWLPYFAMKYPHLEHIKFKHVGLGRYGSSLEIPETVYRLFNDHCRQLKSIKWNKIVVQHDQQEGLFQQNHCLNRIEAYEDFTIPNSLIFSPVVQQDSIMSNLLTSLTLGQPPSSVTTTQVLMAISQCSSLTRLKIQECFSSTFNIDEILLYCQHLNHLTLKDTHISTTQLIQEKQHPLKTLIMKRLSFTEGIFPALSKACAGLKYVEVIGCVQEDRRDQVKIELPEQNLHTLKIQGLRTRRFYVGCRIRFFDVNNVWYYMTKYNIRTHPIGMKRLFRKYKNLEFATSFDKLDNRDIQELKSLVTTENLKAWDIKKHQHQPFTMIDVSCWDPENIYYSGLVKLSFNSVQKLIINDKLVQE